MAEFLISKQEGELTKDNNRETCDYQCFFNVRKHPLIIEFTANYRILDNYKEVKTGGKLWNKLLQYCIKNS